MTITSNPPYRWPGHGKVLHMWDQVEQFCQRKQVSSQVRAMLSPGAGEKILQRLEKITLLVILHYLLKNNSRDFNTGCCKNQLSESPDDPPKNAWGAWLKWEDRA